MQSLVDFHHPVTMEYSYKSVFFFINYTYQKLSFSFFSIHNYLWNKVSKGTKLRMQYNQVPQLTQDTYRDLKSFFIAQHWVRPQTQLWACVLMYLNHGCLTA